VDEIVKDANEKLYSNIIYNKLHVLNHILLGTKDTNIISTIKNSSISESDFITRMLFKNV